jgi:hypothetical protein
LTRDWLELIGKFVQKLDDIKNYRGLLDEKDIIVAKIGRISVKDDYKNGPIRIKFLGKQLIQTNRSIDTTICNSLCNYIDNLDILYVTLAKTTKV